MYFGVGEVNILNIRRSTNTEVATNITAVVVSSGRESPGFCGNVSLKVKENGADGSSVDARGTKGMAKWTDRSNRRASGKALFKGDALFVYF